MENNLGNLKNKEDEALFEKEDKKEALKKEEKKLDKKEVLADQKEIERKDDKNNKDEKGIDSKLDEDIKAFNDVNNMFYLRDKRSKIITIILVVLIALVVILISFFTIRKIMNNKKFKHEQELHKQGVSKIEDAPRKSRFNTW